MSGGYSGVGLRSESDGGRTSGSWKPSLSELFWLYPTEGFMWVCVLTTVVNQLTSAHPQEHVQALSTSLVHSLINSCFRPVCSVSTEPTLVYRARDRYLLSTSLEHYVTSPCPKQSCHKKVPSLNNSLMIEVSVLVMFIASTAFVNTHVHVHVACMSELICSCFLFRVALTYMYMYMYIRILGWHFNLISTFCVH